MSTHYSQPNKTYEAPKAEVEKYEYQQYEPVEDYYYEAPAKKEAYVDSYWTPSYEYIQEKYSDEKYPKKEYIPEKTVEDYGTKKADYLIGNEYDNVVKTYGQNDVIEAGYGSDKIDVGKGDDYLWGISKEHNAEDQKYSQEKYKEVDWLTGGEGKDVYALGTEKYAHYATNGEKDYAVITDYTAGKDAVMLHGASNNYVVGESTPIEKEEAMGDKAASLYWDQDKNGSYSQGDDMVAVFEGYTPDAITAAKDSFVYVAA